MREKPRDIGRLKHIQGAIENISQFMDGKSSYDLISDKMLYFAVVKNLEIIGEAAYMLTHDFIDSHPDTPWRDIIDMRHILVHGYYQIDAKIVWSTLQENLPPLKIEIESYIAELTA